MLLLVVALAIGLIVMQNLLGNTTEPRGIRKAWYELLKKIGDDLP